MTTFRPDPIGRLLHFQPITYLIARSTNGSPPVASELNGVPGGRTFRVVRTGDAVRAEFRVDPAHIVIAVISCINGFAIAASLSWRLWEEWVAEQPHPVEVMLFGGRAPLPPMAQILMAVGVVLGLFCFTLGPILLVLGLYPRVIIVDTRKNTCRLRHLPGFDVVVGLADVLSVQVASSKSGRSLVGKLLISVNGRKAWFVTQTSHYCKDDEIVLRKLRPFAEALSEILGKPVQVVGHAPGLAHGERLT